MAAVADPPGGGLNEAVAAATAAARARGARGIFVLPVDLPLLTAAGLRDLLAQASPAPVCLLVPDRRGAGTNLIYQSPIRLASYAFGDGSFERHRRAAQAAGLKVLVRREPSFALDLDFPADYTLWRELIRATPQTAGHRIDDEAHTHGV
jgi:2-phospho-L-lactate guanylyltransferase